MSTLTADAHVHHEDCGHDVEEFVYDGPPVIDKEDFTSLHVHTEHSFLDGIPKVSQLIERVVELNQGAVAVTDHGEVSGHLRLQKEADKADIKPIFGIESYFCDDRTEKKGKKGELYHHLTVLAKSNRGLHNLWALASQAFIDGQHYADPRCDWELLRRYQQDMIVTGGCIGGAVSAFYNDEGRDYNEDIGAARISQMLDIFGPNFYLEIHTFNDPLHHKLNKKLLEVANDFSIPCIAVSDSHYLRPEDWEDHELLTAIQMRKTYDDPTRYQYGPNQLRLFGEREVRERLSYLPDSFVSECIANTKMIADSCDARIEGTRMMPVFFDSRETDSIKMRERVEEGFKRKIEAHKKPEKWPEYRERLEYEIGIIDPKDFPGYFHTVGDIMTTAKENDILTGPGRGSAAGSMLAYLMDITEIDPIPAGLIFERFLDPERNSLPDIDLDFPQLERHTVRGLIEDKYGKLNVATIGALNTLAAKTLMRDLCRGLKIPMDVCNEMIKIINDVPDLEVAHIDTSWPIIMQEVGYRFREPRTDRDGRQIPSFLESYPRLFDLMEKFLDHIRHSAAHAAGVVISKEPLLGRLPLRMKNDDIRTQFDFKDVEELGFVKIDILGLRTLSTLMRARKLIMERHPDCGLADFHDWQYEWDKYYEDQDVLRGLWEGKNIGIFQLESAGLRQTAKRFKPTSLEDVCALISVYRPGITRTFDEETGLNLLDLYIERRDGLREASYKHPKQEAILGVTNGNFLYQEQIMFTCAELAGYSLAETDRVRKILGKKLVDKMILERQIFVKGCIENGIDERTAESIFDDMENFGKYGFNKSHGYAYAMVAMWCAWIKHHYPREFMTALFMTNEEDAPMYTRECQRLGIPLLPPDINESKSDFSITPGGVIRYGLSKIKFMAKGAAVLEEFQPFSSVEDLVARVPKSRVNKKALTAAILCGAMDSLITDEDKANYPEWYTVQQIALHKFYTARKEKVAKDFDALCDDCDLASATTITDEHSNFDHLCSEFQILDRTYCEKEYLGSVLSHDPIAPFRAVIRKEHNYVSEESMVTSEKCKIGGTVSKVRPLVTKKGKNPGAKMCQMWIDLPLHVVGDDDGIDEEGEEQVQLVVFPDAYAKYEEIIEAGAPVLAYAEKMKNDGGLSLYRLIRLDHLMGDNQ